MPLFPPPQLFEHPTDLVIDVFGTYLGKRSERLIVRWRDPDSLQSPIRADHDSSTLTSATASDSAPSSLSDNPAAPTSDMCAAGDDTSQRVPANSSSGPDDSDSACHPSQGDPAGSDSETSIDSNLGEPVLTAEHLAGQLLKIWQDRTPPKIAQPVSRFDRLQQQLGEIADPTSHDRTIGRWKEQAVPLSRLRSITISGRGVTVSSDLINALVERGIAISFLDGRGQPVAQLIAPGLSGTVQTRRSQLAAYDSPLGVDLAVEFIRGKLRNQKHQLQYSAKYLKSSDPDRFERLVKKVKAISALRQQLASFSAEKLDLVRDKLMGYEGTGARLYWEGVAILLEGRASFSNRVTRGAIDPVNSALNYGYGILYGQVSSAVANAGLELFAGFLHVDRPGKPALVLDLVEEFRAPVVDRSVLAIVNQGTSIETDAHGLTAASRKLVAQRVLERLATAVPYEGKRWPLRNIIQNQARHLAVAVRGERQYRAFASRW